MPVIKSARKQMRQNLKRRARNYPIRSELKTLIKKELEFIKEGNLEEAEKFLKKVYSVIDMSCKKRIIHENNASRKKSRLARVLNEAKAKNSGKAVLNEEKAEKKEEK